MHHLQTAYRFKSVHLCSMRAVSNFLFYRKIIINLRTRPRAPSPDNPPGSPPDPQTSLNHTQGARQIGLALRPGSTGGRSVRAIAPAPRFLHAPQVAGVDAQTVDTDSLLDLATRSDHVQAYRAS